MSPKTTKKVSDAVTDLEGIITILKDSAKESVSTMTSEGIKEGYRLMQDAEYLVQVHGRLAKVVKEPQAVAA